MTTGKLTSVIFFTITIFLFSTVVVLAAKPTVAKGERATDAAKASPVAKGLVCGGVSGKECPGGFVCRYEDNYPDAQGVCIKNQATASAEGKRRSCEAKKTAVGNRSGQIIRFSNNMIDKFASISGRVQNFYTNKVIPSGNTVASYSALLADIEAKKASASAAVSEASSAAAAFDCDSAPKEQLTAFHQKMKGVITSLKEYRRSVRNLIVAVHTAFNQGEKSATGTARNKNKLTPTTTPTATPTATDSGGTQ